MVRQSISYLFYWLGDIASRLPWFGWDRWSWKFYQFCMEKSLELDEDCSIWKKVEPKEVRKSKSRKAKKLRKK
jgi:hypothetical protein